MFAVIWCEDFDRLLLHLQDWGVQILTLMKYLCCLQCCGVTILTDLCLQHCGVKILMDTCFVCSTVV